MDFLKNYTLPDDISKFILAGRESSTRFRQAYGNDHQMPEPLPIRELTVLFTYYHNKVFFQASRNDVTNVEPEGLRDNLQSMITAAAALCDIAHVIRNHQDFVRHQTRELLGHLAKDFYMHHTRREVHPKIFEWMKAAITVEERAENELRKTDPSRGKTVREHLAEMFVFPEAPRSVRPAADETKPVAARTCESVK